MHIILFLITMFRAGLCYKAHEVQRGSDVSLKCDVPLLSESSTLQWMRDGGQTSNTTLVYNNSAYIILHNVDDHSEGKYYCRLIEDGREKTVIHYTLNVTSYSRNKKLTIYRQSSNHSDLSLICKSKKKYHRLMWTWESRHSSQIVLIAVEEGRKVQVKGPIKPGRNSSTTYNGHVFIFHISPVNFNYSGTYISFPNDNNTSYTTTKLSTIRVSAEPPCDVLRNQSVVLTCEVSDVTDPVTLVWLRMKGIRGVLVKQQILNETNNKIILTVNLTSLQSDLLHWQCAVFTENILKAVAPITISLISSTTHAPSTLKETTTSTNQEDTLTQDSHLHTVILMACAVAVSVCILLGLLAYKRQRKTFTDDEGCSTVLNSREEEEEIHYASVTVAGCSQGSDSWLKPNPARLKVLESSATVIYSAIKIH